MQYLRINNNYVDQSEIIISKNKLSTSHLGTCSAVLFSINKINLLGHIDAMYNKKEEIINKIKNNFDIKELKKNNIYIIPGEWCNNNCDTFNIIIDSLNELELKYNIIENIKWQNIIRINNNNIEII